MSTRSISAGVLGAAALAVFYLGVVGGLGGLDHLPTQALNDAPWLVLILAGFGAQVALYVELRRRRRLAASVRTTTAGGAGASALGMAACCAHHVADFAPILGISGAAVFLTTYRLPIMLTGIAINALGVALSARRLHRLPLPTPSPALIER